MATTTNKTANTNAANAQVKNVQVINKVGTTSETAQVVDAKKCATYIQRMQADKAAMTSLSKLWKNLHTDALCANALPAKDDAKAFGDFRDYMKKRHNIEGDETPARGWSVWYALQWCEKSIKESAKNGNALAKKWASISAKDLAAKLAKVQ